MLADGNQAAESSDSELRSKDLPVKNEELKVQSELNTEEPKPAEEAETPNEMDLEQSTGFKSVLRTNLIMPLPDMDN